MLSESYDAEQPPSSSRITPKGGSDAVFFSRNPGTASVWYTTLMNREPFAEEEYYHIYNRGVDKRKIFSDSYDVGRFLKSMEFFNSIAPIGSLYALSFEEEKKPGKQLVDVIAYCLNPNHYHFILKALVSHGIPEFMKRLNGGYTWYFNHRTKRSGALFQGVFKSKHIFDNDYLLHVSAYVNLNDKVHQLSGFTAKLISSSWEEYTKKKDGFCKTNIILDQFKSKKKYEEFALEILPEMLKRKEDEKELASLLME